MWKNEKKLTYYVKRQNHVGSLQLPFSALQKTLGESVFGKSFR